MKSFKDKVVVIAGAASGIGQATAKKFHNMDAKVHLADINPGVHGAAKQISSTVSSHEVDVRDFDSVTRLARSVLDKEGRVDILMNSAGICRPKPAAELTMDDWRAHLDINLMGVIHGMQAFVPSMVEHKTGHIINMASMAGLLPVPTVAPYCASKFAVVGLSESMAADLAPYGIKVTVICPGAVDTPLLSRAAQDLSQEPGSMVPRLFERLSLSPQKQASEIIKAVQRGKVIHTNPGLMYPMLLVQRTSRDLYDRLWGLSTRFLTKKSKSTKDT